MAASMVRQLLGRCLSLNPSQCLPGRPAGRPQSMTTPLSLTWARLQGLSSCTRSGSNQGVVKFPVSQPQLQVVSPLLRACQPLMNSVRTLIRYSIRQGKPKPNRAVIGRFFRLGWGIYIRPRAGRGKRLWSKPDWIVQRGKQHVFCNKQQSKMLDKMTTRYWKKRRYYVDDPYEVYHTRPGPSGHDRPRFVP